MTYSMHRETDAIGHYVRMQNGDLYGPVEGTSRDDEKTEFYTNTKSDGRPIPVWTMTALVVPHDESYRFVEEDGIFSYELV